MSKSIVDIISRKLKETEMSRTVRLICCGVPFDFDLLKLENLFPHNILKSLVDKSSENKAEDGAAILRLNSDVQSMRLIYLYYNTMDLIIPESQIERELMLITCDYFGFTEISKQIEFALSGGLDETTTGKSNKKDTDGEQEKDDADHVEENIEADMEEHSNDDAEDSAEQDPDFVNIRQNKTVTTTTTTTTTETTNTGLNIIANPSCKISDLDKKILSEETALRKDYAMGNRARIPRIKFTEACKDPLEIDHPYTLVKSNKKINYEFVSTNEEFMENLKLYSFGILDEFMPSCLVVAGSAAMKCSLKIDPSIIPRSIMKELLMYYPSNVVNNDSSSSSNSSSSNSETDDDVKKNIREKLKEKKEKEKKKINDNYDDGDYNFISKIESTLNPANSFSKEKILLLKKMIVCHAKHFYGLLVRKGIAYDGYGYRRMRVANQVTFTNFMKKLAKDSPSVSNDIDLFLTTENPDTILEAIRYVHDKLHKQFGVVSIIRTQNSISFYVDHLHMMPSIQIILRAYDSVEHVILGFDIDSCCIGYDGEIICSERFLRAIRYGYNLVDVTRLSTTYEVRLMKYYLRGFDIAMTEPAIKENTDAIMQIIEKHGGLFYTMLRGIYKLSYLLISYHKLAKIKKVITESDYNHKSVSMAVRMLATGINKVDFVYGTDLDKVLFGSESEIVDTSAMSWSKRRYFRSLNKNITKESDIPPLRVMRKNVTKQTDSDELFTGSFNPIQMAWYDGDVVV